VLSEEDDMLLLSAMEQNQDQVGAGLEKTRFKKKKTQPSGFFWVFWGFFGFFGFFWVFWVFLGFLPRREGF
jgi:hypothetical protein